MHVNFKAVSKASTCFMTKKIGWDEKQRRRRRLQMPAIWCLTITVNYSWCLECLATWQRRFWNLFTVFAVVWNTTTWRHPKPQSLFWFFLKVFFEFFSLFIQFFRLARFLFIIFTPNLQSFRFMRLEKVKLIQTRRFHFHFRLTLEERTRKIK